MIMETGRNIKLACTVCTELLHISYARRACMMGNPFYRCAPPGDPLLVCFLHRSHKPHLHIRSTFKSSARLPDIIHTPIGSSETMHAYLIWQSTGPRYRRSLFADIAACVRVCRMLGVALASATFASKANIPASTQEYCSDAMTGTHPMCCSTLNVD